MCVSRLSYFLIVAKLLFLSIMHSPNISGLKIFNREIWITQFEDDTALFLKDKSQIDSDASGLEWNINKSLQSFVCIKLQRIFCILKIQIQILLFLLKNYEQSGYSHKNANYRYQLNIFSVKLKK